ncbi:MAG TPA: DUF115 domain-containing protein [bacterium]|nr:DUF115 domain-containing protein [bacterium]
MTNNIYQKNIEVLKSKHYSEYLIYEKIAEQYSNNAGNKYAIIYSDDNIPIPVNIQTKKTIYQPNNCIKQLYNVLVNISDYSEYIFLGFGAGYHLQILSKLKQTAKFIVFENNFELFDIIIKNIDISDVLNNQNFYFFLDVNNNISNILQRLELKFGGIFLLDNPILLNLDYDIAYTTLAKLFRGEIILPQKTNNLPTQINKNLATLRLFNESWRKNIINNALDYLSAPKLSVINNLFTNTPVLIIAAGPSLDEDIKQIKNLKNKILIICVDTALKTLIANNIAPDIIVSIDISKNNLKYLENVEIDAVLICDIAMPKNILEKFKNKTILIHYGHSIAVYLDNFKNCEKTKIDRIASIGTVSAVAFDIANRLGCSIFFFLGFDFAYTKNQIHCKIADVENYQALNKFFTIETFFYQILVDENVMIENNHFTSGKFLNWREWFNTNMDLLKKQYNIKFYNATKYGLTLKSAQKINVENIIDYLPNKKIYRDYLMELKTIFKSANKMNIEKLMQDLKEKLTEANNILTKIDKYIGRIELRGDTKNAERFYFEILVLYNNLLNCELSKILRWALYLDEMSFRKITNSYNPENYQILKKIIENYHIYFSEISGLLAVKK